MKIIQIGKFYPPHFGGIETLLYNLSHGLKQQGPAVTVIVFNDSGQTVIETDQGIQVIRTGIAGTLFSQPFSFDYLRQIHQIKGDIYHLHLPNPLVNMIFLLLKPRAKIVVSYHSDIVKQTFLKRLYTPFLKALLQRAEKIVVATPHHVTSSEILTSFQQKTAVIPYGIDLSRFESKPNPERVKQIQSACSNRQILLFVGRLVYYKGVEVLIRAMQILKAKMTKVPVCLIIGQGPEESRLISLIHQLQLDLDVLMVGDKSESEIVPYYQAADIFVLPSVANSEAFGIVQLEAMACRVPVISTDLKTGVTFVNLDGLTGLIARPNDPADLADKIQKLLSDGRLRKRLGEQGHQRVSQLFTMEQMTRSYIELYQSII